MMRWQTRQGHVHSYDVLRAMQAFAIWVIGHPAANWRRHGIGVLQAYVHEGGPHESRLHVWSPALLLPGIDRSGNMHNHRFTFDSTVLVGAISHVERHLTPDPNGNHETFDFVHARLHTATNRADMRATGERYFVESKEFLFRTGDRYSFPRGAYHSSEPIDIAVTFVQKKDQMDERAKVLAPRNTPPVPAFSGEDDPELFSSVLREAAARLKERLR